MRDTSRRERMQGRDISRRDFVLGRLWRQATNQVARMAAAAPLARPRKPPVMRYPKTLQDVTAGDLPDAPDAPTALPVTTARRRAVPVMRPPGAIDEASFLAGCTRCELCIQACPHDAIMHAPDRLREAAGTPMIDADRQPCLMCADFPCIAACEPDVLSELVPVRIGTARITEQLCVAHHGTHCTVCSDQCPVPNAIVISEGKPTISEVTCTGCGVCRNVCPAPENAILLMPMFLRPVPQERKPSYE